MNDSRMTMMVLLFGLMWQFMMWTNLKVTSVTIFVVIDVGWHQAWHATVRRRTI